MAYTVLWIFQLYLLFRQSIVYLPFACLYLPYVRCIFLLASTSSMKYDLGPSTRSVHVKYPYVIHLHRFFVVREKSILEFISQHLEHCQIFVQSKSQSSEANIYSPKESRDQQMRPSSTWSTQGTHKLPIQDLLQRIHHQLPHIQIISLSNMTNRIKWAKVLDIHIPHTFFLHKRR